MSDTFQYVAGQNYTLSGSGCAATDNTINLTSFETRDGVALAMSDFGNIGYGTLEPKTSKMEIISWTGVTQNADGTATLTGVTRGLKFKAPYDQDTSLRLAHSGGAIFVISNVPQFYNKIAGKADDETITGLWEFATTPIIDNAPVNATDAANKGYVDGVAIAGAPKATDSVYGISKLSVAAVDPLIPIVVGDNDNRVSPVSLAALTAGEVAALPGNNTDVAVGSGNKYVTQTGLQHNAEKYVAVSSGSGTAYVATLSPAPTSQTDGMVVYLKMDVANTSTTPTLAVNGLTARTIVRADGTALALNDIKIGMLCVFMYDLSNTRWVMQTPVANTITTAPYIAQMVAWLQAAKVTWVMAATAPIAGADKSNPFYVMFSDGSSQTAYIYKYQFDARTNAIYTDGTNSNNISVANGSIQFMTVLGNYIYYTGSNAGTFTLKRVDLGTLANNTGITISGTAPSSAGGQWPIFSDGTFLYITDGNVPATINKYSISGTTATFVASITFTSFNKSYSTWCDGTSVYQFTGNFILKWPLAGGAATTTNVALLFTNSSSSPTYFGLTDTTKALVGHTGFIPNTAFNGIGANYLHFVPISSV